jgi:hypothetical protein
VVKLLTIDLRGARKFLGRLRGKRPEVPRGRAGAADNIERLKRELEGYKAEAAVITATPEAMVANAGKAAELRAKITSNKFRIGQMEFIIALMDLNDEHIATLENKLKDMAKVDDDVCKRLDTAVAMAKVNEKLDEAKVVAEAMEGADPFIVWDVVNDMCEQRFTIDDSNKEWHIAHTLQYIFDHTTIRAD